MMEEVPTEPTDLQPDVCNHMRKQLPVKYFQTGTYRKGRMHMENTWIISEKRAQAAKPDLQHLKSEEKNQILRKSAED